VVTTTNCRLAADELDYLLLSGSDRIGALDFQASASEYSMSAINNAIAGQPACRYRPQPVSFYPLLQ